MSTSVVIGELSSRCGFIILLLLLFREQTIHNIVCAELCRVLVVILAGYVRWVSY